MFNVAGSSQVRSHCKFEGAGPVAVEDEPSRLACTEHPIEECIDTCLGVFDSHAAEIERVVLELSADAGDEGTNALMSDYIREQEKSVWMYSSYAKGK